ncbi:MAG: hypothetical protein LBU39_07360 [Desulfobulbaceae bacterium]|nr:hypothetical protein [Desulfobulbaceae bacterium]
MNAPFLTPSAEPRITSWRSGTVCHFTAFFPDFHQLINGKFCHVGLSAVLADGGGAKKYYALRHPAAQPDFHHAGGWTLALSASSGRQGCKSHFFHSDS